MASGRTLTVVAAVTCSSLCVVPALAANAKAPGGRRPPAAAGGAGPSKPRAARRRSAAEVASQVAAIAAVGGAAAVVSASGKRPSKASKASKPSDYRAEVLRRQADSPECGWSQLDDVCRALEGEVTRISQIGGSLSAAFQVAVFQALALADKKGWHFNVELPEGVTPEAFFFQLQSLAPAARSSDAVLWMFSHFSIASGDLLRREGDSGPRGLILCTSQGLRSPKDIFLFARRTETHVWDIRCQTAKQAGYLESECDNQLELVEEAFGCETSEKDCGLLQARQVQVRRIKDPRHERAAGALRRTSLQLPRLCR